MTNPCSAVLSSPRWALLPLLLLALASFTVFGDNEPGPVRDGVFIHLSAGPENPHRVLMALKMAMVMAEGNKDVLVYGDIEAVNLLVAGAPDVTHEAFPSAQEALNNLLAAGVPVRACPSCLKAAGKQPEDLRPGIQVADRDEFFSFTKGRILTLDY